MFRTWRYAYELKPGMLVKWEPGWRTVESVELYGTPQQHPIETAES